MRAICGGVGAPAYFSWIIAVAPWLAFAQTAVSARASPKRLMTSGLFRANLQNSVTVNGAAGTVQAIGAVYAPNGDFTFNGQLPTISFLVAGTITMNGGGLNAGDIGGFPQPGNAVLAE